VTLHRLDQSPVASMSPRGAPALRPNPSWASIRHLPVVDAGQLSFESVGVFWRRVPLVAGPRSALEARSRRRCVFLAARHHPGWCERALGGGAPRQRVVELDEVGPGGLFHMGGAAGGAEEWPSLILARLVGAVRGPGGGAD
jgi:hypothetical protein